MGLSLGTATKPEGSVGLQVIRASGGRWPAREMSVEEIEHLSQPQKGLSTEVNAWRKANKKNLVRSLRPVLLARKHRLPHFYGTIFLSVIRRDGERIDLGLASLAVVTTGGVGYIVDAFQNLTEVENFRFHGLGVGTVAEAVGDAGLGTELTTQYITDSTRATGTITESAQTVYRTVATNTVDAAVAITEHGIFSQAATGAASATNVLLDRSVFAAVNLASGDSLQSTYDLTINAGG